MRVGWLLLVLLACSSWNPSAKAQLTFYSTFWGSSYNASEYKSAVAAALNLLPAPQISVAFQQAVPNISVTLRTELSQPSGITPAQLRGAVRQLPLFIQSAHGFMSSWWKGPWCLSQRNGTCGDFTLQLPSNQVLPPAQQKKEANLCFVIEMSDNLPAQAAIVGSTLAAYRELGGSTIVLRAISAPIGTVLGPITVSEALSSGTLVRDLVQGASEGSNGTTQRVDLGLAIARCQAYLEQLGELASAKLVLITSGEPETNSIISKGSSVNSAVKAKEAGVHILGMSISVNSASVQTPYYMFQLVSNFDAVNLSIDPQGRPPGPGLVTQGAAALVRRMSGEADTCMTGLDCEGHCVAGKCVRAAAACTKSCLGGRVCLNGQCLTARAPLSFRLLWSGEGKADLDLYVKDENGCLIYWVHQESTCSISSGLLESYCDSDLKSKLPASCRPVAQEYVYIQNPVGRYRVAVNLWGLQEGSRYPVRYRLLVSYGGRRRKSISGQITAATPVTNELPECRACKANFIEVDYP